jgi:hypothetical protein
MPALIGLEVGFQFEQVGAYPATCFLIFLCLSFCEVGTSSGRFLLDFSSFAWYTASANGLLLGGELNGVFPMPLPLERPNLRFFIDHCRGSLMREFSEFAMA